MDSNEQPSPARERTNSLRIVLQSDEDAAHQARRYVNGLGDLLPPAVLADLRTIVSELVTNCFRHGTGREIELTVAVARDGSVRGRVGDGGTARVEIVAPPPSRDTGLGLRIVDALVSRWGVAGPSSDIWFELAPCVQTPP